MDRFRYINEEQRRRMMEYQRRLSDSAGYDVGEEGYLEWVERYAADYREWANDICESDFSDDLYIGEEFTGDLDCA